MCVYAGRITLVLLGLIAMTPSCVRGQKDVEFVVEIAMVPQIGIGPMKEGATALVFIEALSPVSLVVESAEGITATVVAEPREAALREALGHPATMPFHGTYRLFVRAEGKADFVRELGLVVLDEKKIERRRAMIAVATRDGTLFLSRERALTLRQFIDALELGKAGKP